MKDKWPNTTFLVQGGVKLHHICDHLCTLIQQKMGEAWKSVYEEKLQTFEAWLSKRSKEEWTFRYLVPKKDVPEARVRELRIREWLVVVWDANDIAPNDDRDVDCPFVSEAFDPLRWLLPAFECPVLIAGCYQLRWRGTRSSCYRNQLAPYLLRIRKYALVFQ
jgi:hypothetical protein